VFLKILRSKAQKWLNDAMEATQCERGELPESF
jgi:hypothetical protein